MMTGVLTAEVALFLLIAGLLGVISVVIFRFSASVADLAALRARDAQRIHTCQRLSTAVLMICALLTGIGGLF